MVKQIVIGLAFIGGISLLVKNKVDNWRKILPQLQAFPTDFNRLKFENKSISFFIDVTIFNPTREFFNPNGVIAQLDRLLIMVKGQEIARVAVKKSDIQIPAEGKYTLKNLKVEVPYRSLGLAVNVRGMDDIDINAVINVLGEEYTI